MPVLAQTDTLSPKILAVDDDASVLELVRFKLDRAGFNVVTATSGPDALRQIDRHGLPHLAIVDLNMPKMSGFQLCERLQQFTDLPIILLSAIDDEDTIVQGIERYAEDYMTKPFSPREMVVRIQRILRRMGNFEYTFDPVTTIDDRLSVDFAHQQATIDGQPVLLTATETKILYILMRNAGQTVTSDFLLRRLWPFDDVFEDALRVHIHRLRHKIEPKPSKPIYILTRRGLGYRFPRLKS